MTNDRDLDSLHRSQSGDKRARVDLFKKFIWEDSRVRRLGSAYRDSNDFLHDCCANVLRTAHSFRPEQDLATWIESVALWTAMERQRMRDADPAAVDAQVRLCAGVEGDEADDRARLASYVPPRVDSNATLGSRIKAIVGEIPYSILSSRAGENALWEEAAATGKSLHLVGPIVVRAVDRLARFFGAPPPLNADLEKVFSAMVREDAASHGDPEKNKGRILAMHLDPAFYAVTPELRKIGLSVAAEVRTVTLWEASRSSTPPEEALRTHLASCRYCADLFRAILLMQNALQNLSTTNFRLCPGAVTLLNTASKAYPALDLHLDDCDLCRTEQSALYTARDSDDELDQPAPGGAPTWNKKLVWGAAALILLSVGFLAQRHYSKAEVGDKATAARESLVGPPPPIVTVNARYKVLAQPIALDDKHWLASVLPANVGIFSQLSALLNRGQTGTAVVAASQLADLDPGIAMLYAVGLYGQQAASEGYYQMGKAEAMSPRNSFRCWTMLQCALIVGDLKVVERETEHLASDPEYAKRAQDLLAKARAIK